MTHYGFASFTPGTTLELGTATVDHDEMLAFAQRFDPQPFHVDPVAARNSLLGGLCASGWFTAALWMRAWVDAVLADSTSQGSPGGREIAWLAPVFPNDVLHFSAEVLSVRVSGSRPNLGLVEITGRAVRLAPATPAEPDQGADPDPARGSQEVLRMTFTGIFGVD